MPGIPSNATKAVLRLLSFLHFADNRRTERKNPCLLYACLTAPNAHLKRL
jgi:hypothetical protein